jgi:hypothetical protein
MAIWPKKKTPPREAVLLAILGVAALVTALMAAAAELIAIYRLTAEAYGDYAGLGVVAAILGAGAGRAVFVGTAILASASSTSTLAYHRPLRPRSVCWPCAGRVASFRTIPEPERGSAEAIVDANIASVGPAPLLESLHEGGDASLRL